MVEKPFVLVRQRKAFFIGRLGLKSLLVSVLLHVVLLIDFAVPDMGALAGGRERPPMMARLVEMPADFSPPQQPERGAAVSRAARPNRKPVTPDQAFANLGQNFRLTAQAPREQVEPSRADASTGDAVVEPDMVREYRLKLARMARNVNAAVPGTVEGGIVVLSIRKVAGDVQPEVLLDRGSGQAVLDAYAIAVIAKAVKEGDVPASLSERTFNIYLSMHFDAGN